LAQETANGNDRPLTNQFLAKIAVLLLALSPFASATAQEASPPSEPPPRLEHVAIETPQGTISLALDATNAPVTTANFLHYADEKRYDGAEFQPVSASGCFSLAGTC
jgi:hypothetical protein